MITLYSPVYLRRFIVSLRDIKTTSLNAQKLMDCSSKDGCRCAKMAADTLSFLPPNGNCSSIDCGWKIAEQKLEKRERARIRILSDNKLEMSPESPSGKEKGSNAVVFYSYWQLAAAVNACKRWEGEEICDNAQLFESLSLSFFSHLRKNGALFSELCMPPRVSRDLSAFILVAICEPFAFCFRPTAKLTSKTLNGITF